MNKILLPLLLLSFSFSPVQAIAQVSADLFGTLNLRAYPEYPGPDTNVDIYLEAAGIDLDSSLISWSVNGSSIKSGRGERGVSLKTGPIGTRSTVVVSVQSPTGTLRETKIIDPSEVDLLWQGEVYTPPFYSGKTLWPRQGKITIVAIPHVTATGGGELDPSNLVYKWSKDGVVLGQSSGFGKNSISFTDSIISRPPKIMVEIFSGNSPVAKKTVLYKPVSAIIRPAVHKQIRKALSCFKIRGAFMFISYPAKNSTHTKNPLLSKQSILTLARAVAGGH